MIGILINKILSMALMMLIGAIFVRFGILRSDDSRVLSALSLYIILPCVILTSFQVDFTAEVRNGLLLALTAAVIIHIALILLNTLLGKLLRLDAVEQASVIYSNAGNLIIPLVTALLGKDQVIYCCAFICVQMILLWSHGKMLLCGEKGIDIKKILTNINMIAIFIGIALLLTGVRFPAIVEDTMDSISGMVGPVAMLITGMIIGGHSVKVLLHNRRLWFTTVLRLVVIPLLVLIFLKFSGIAQIVPDGKKVLLVTFLAVITPSASTVTQLAQIYGQDADYAGSINVLTTILCIITMPVMVALYQL